MKKIATALVLLSISHLFAAPSRPPMPPMFGSNSAKPYPESCKTLPKMIIFLPPPMEVDFIKCKNDLYMPTVYETQQVLKKRFGKDVQDVTVSLAKGFYQLYRVDFQLNKEKRTVFVNSALTKFIDGKAMDFNEKRSSLIPAPKDKGKN